MTKTPSETRQIDGHTYEVFALPAWHAIDVFHQLTRALSPAIGAIGKDGGEGLAALAGAIDRMLASLSPAELVRLSKTLLAGARVEVDGKNLELLPIVDLHFQRRIFTLLKVLAFAVEVNFPDFLAPLRGVSGRIAAKASVLLRPTETASTPTGPVGG